LAVLDHFGIEYLIVGGVAVGFYAEPRYTKDLDIFIKVGADDVGRLFEALREYGAPVHLTSPEEFLTEDFVFYFGAPPWRIDILTAIPGVDFDAAYRDRAEVMLSGYSATCISREWLIRAKRASGRAQDLADIAMLELEPPAASNS